MSVGNYEKVMWVYVKYLEYCGSKYITYLLCFPGSLLTRNGIVFFDLTLLAGHAAPAYPRMKNRHFVHIVDLC